MYTDLTNLLPSERVHALGQSYLLRLGTLIALMVAGLAIIHGILLTPTYIYLDAETELRRTELAELSEERAASGYEDLAKRVATLSSRADALMGLSTTRAGSDMVRAVMDIPRSGIALQSFAFAPSTAGGSMTLIGIATTRENLRAFDGALGKLAFVRATDLPLSAYAKESDIPFSIVLTLTPAQ